MNNDDGIRIKTKKALSDEEIIAAIDAKVNGEDSSGFSSGYDSEPVFSVRELAEALETSSHTIRYYDNEHLFPFVSRSVSNERFFSKADMAYGRMIICLRKLGLSIHDCRLFILDTMEGDSTALERLRILVALQKKLEDEIAALNNSLNDLQIKIRYYSHLTEAVEEEKQQGTFEDRKRGSMRNLHDFIVKQKEIYFEDHERHTSFPLILENDGKPE